MNIRMAALAACALVLGGSPARADIIQFVFTGVVSGAGLGVINPGGLPETSLIGDPYSATLTFDTTKSVPNRIGDFPNSLTGGLIEATFSLNGFVQLGGTSFGSGISFYGWSDDFSHGSAEIHDGFFIFAPFGGIGGAGGFQTGPCPGRPCGQLRTDSTTITVLSTSPVGVPGPVVGGSLPGLLAMLALMLGRRRYVKERVKVLPKS